MQQPVGFYHDSTPSLSKVAFLLGKMEITYRLTPVDIAKGSPRSARFRALDLNGKVPVAIENGIASFDSTAVLLHLGKGIETFLGKQSDRGRAERIVHPRGRDSVVVSTPEIGIAP